MSNDFLKPYMLDEIQIHMKADEDEETCLPDKAIIGLFSDDESNKKVLSEELKKKLIELKNAKKKKNSKSTRTSSIFNVNYDHIVDKALETNNINITYLERSLLMHAIRINDINLVLMLLKDGIDVNFRNYQGSSALWYAYDERNYKIFKILIEYGADINIEVSYGKSLSSIITNGKNSKFIELLENANQIRQEFLEKQKEKTLGEFLDEDRDKTPDELIEEARNKLKRTLTL